MDRHVLPNDLMLGEVARLLASGRDVIMTPKGISMLPFIRGDIDSVLLRKREQIEVGDIVLAHFGGVYILHRVIATDEATVTLMGDGNLQGIEKGKRSDVIGTVVEIIGPDGKHRIPGKGRLWYKLLPVRKYLLKIRRKWNKIFKRN